MNVLFGKLLSLLSNLHRCLNLVVCQKYMQNLACLHLSHSPSLSQFLIAQKYQTDFSFVSLWNTGCEPICKGVYGTYIWKVDILIGNTNIVTSNDP